MTNYKKTSIIIKLMTLELKVHEQAAILDILSDDGIIISSNHPLQLLKMWLILG